ncbi:MAG: phosphoribosylanthranilate isomerase [Clostridium sp.]|nr:phosphoribosylanthranilate isomerase [Clostridium sp.]MCM1546780.1 phosphoribosylanthranilate isomerase [Ruminococcus sp.]
MTVKLCGMRRPEDIEYINEFQPDYAGFILSPGFKRSIAKKQYLDLESRLDRQIGRVGVFVNEPMDKVIDYSNYLDVIQLHGDEDPSYIKSLKSRVDRKIWKAVRVKTCSDIESADKLGVDMLLLDAFVQGSYGGTGKTIDHEIIRNAVFAAPFFIAGGLNCNNIKSVIDKISPDGVDISSGIETNGVKDKEKIKTIMEIIRSV